MRKSWIVVSFLMVVMLLARWTVSVSAATTFLYGNHAGTPKIFRMDPASFTVLETYSPISGGNGRGVVVVGDTMYYTAADSGNVFSYTLSTHTNNGVAFPVAGASGLSTIAYDGTNLWIGDYSGTNKAFLYTPGGALIKTVTLANCTSYCDGLEYFVQGGAGRLISNRGDSTGGPYDVYDTNGVLLTPAFLTCCPTLSSGGRGIAYDGINFFVAQADSISRFNGTTGAAISTTTVTTGSPNFEDLSADYAQVLGTPAPAVVPAVSTWGLILSGILLLLLAGKMLRSKLSAEQGAARK